MDAGESFKSSIARAYDASADAFSELADRLVFSHLAGILDIAVPAPEGRILDVAGGTGAVARRWSDPVCVDISHGQLVRNQVPHKVQSDAEALPFPDGTFVASLCAFGINHFPNPVRAVREMARVGGNVGILTWLRPEPKPFEPREIVMRTLGEHAGRTRSETGDAIDRMTDEVGNADALRDIFEAAGIDARVTVVERSIPWDNTEDFVDYRLAMLGAPGLIDDVDTVRTAAIERIRSLPEEELVWNAAVVLGVGGPGIGFEGNG